MGNRFGLSALSEPGGIRTHDLLIHDQRAVRPFPVLLVAHGVSSGADRPSALVRPNPHFSLAKRLHSQIKLRPSLPRSPKPFYLAASASLPSDLNRDGQEHAESDMTAAVCQRTARPPLPRRIRTCFRTDPSRSVRGQQ